MNWLKGRFKYALVGLKTALSDRSIRFQFLLGCLAIVAGLLLSCSWTEWLWISLAIALVWAAEIFNSCIEGCVDYISLKKDPRAKKIKDMAAGAVFIISCFALFVGCVIFIPKLI